MLRCNILVHRCVRLWPFVGRSAVTVAAFWAGGLQKITVPDTSAAAAPMACGLMFGGADHFGHCAQSQIPRRFGMPGRQHARLRKSQDGRALILRFIGAHGCLSTVFVETVALDLVGKPHARQTELGRSAALVPVVSYKRAPNDLLFETLDLVLKRSTFGNEAP